MSRRLRLCLYLFLAVLALAPAARADGQPAGGAVQGGTGVLSADGVRYLALGAGGDTVLEAVQTKGGRLRNWTDYAGSWGIPEVTPTGNGGGLSADGKTLVLGSVSVGAESRFLIVDTRTLRAASWVALNGSFAFDALSPDASRLYLIQHVSQDDLAHYVVRGYDLRTNRLLPGRIADKTQKDWVMQGYPTTRTTSANGRWVYTLYMNPGGYPFVHALDTVRGAAHCIGLPWTGDQTPIWNLRLGLGNGEKMLTLRWKSGRTWLAVNTASWRITHPQPGGFPWRWVLVGAGGAIVVLLALGIAAVGRRSQPGLAEAAAR